jgi:hypothetical protein
MYRTKGNNGIQLKIGRQKTIKTLDANRNKATSKSYPDR